MAQPEAEDQIGGVGGGVAEGVAEGQTGGVAEGQTGGQTGGAAGGQTGSVTGDLIAPQSVTCAELLCPLLLSAGESNNPSHVAGLKQLHQQGSATL